MRKLVKNTTRCAEQDRRHSARVVMLDNLPDRFVSTVATWVQMAWVTCLARCLAEVAAATTVVLARNEERK